MFDAGDFKHELLNRLRSTMAVNVLIVGTVGDNIVTRLQRQERKVFSLHTMKAYSVNGIIAY